MTQSDIFNINEEIKDDILIYFNAHRSKIVYKKTGALWITEPFLETEIFWESSKSFKELTSQMIDDMSDHLYDAGVKISKLGGFMTEPLFEIHAGNIPVLVWGVFGC